MSVTLKDVAFCNGRFNGKKVEVVSACRPTLLVKTDDGFQFYVEPRQYEAAA